MGYGMVVDIDECSQAAREVVLGTPVVTANAVSVPGAILAQRQSGAEFPRLGEEIGRGGAPP